MSASTEGDIPILDVEETQLPVVFRRNETYVRARFWIKLRRFFGRVPFTEELVSAYFCAVDRQTPVRAKAVLFAALAYFVLPADIIPDIIGALGFSDDATVLMTAIGVVGPHIKARHREKARRALLKPEPPADE